MKNIEIYISDLLFEHECVIIPGFGGLVSNYQSSTIHPVQHIFTAPRKNLSFNININQNDGLLANHISKNENISYSEALIKVNEYSKKLHSDLKENSSVTIERIGKFELDLENNIIYIADKNINYLSDSFGMENIRFFPIKRESFGQKIEKTLKPYNFEPKKSSSIKNLWIPAAAIIAIGIFILSSKNIDSKSSMAKLFDFNKTEKILYHNRNYNFIDALNSIKETTAFEDYILNSIVVIKKENLFINAADSTNINKEEIIKDIVINKQTTFNYHVIAGCFEKIENAADLLKKLIKNGYPAHMPGKTKNGLYIIAYKSFENYLDAKQMLNDIQRKNDSTSWIIPNSKIIVE